MSRRAFGYTVIAVGTVVLVISALADQIGVGDEEAFGLQQTLGVVVGAVVAVAGLVLARLGNRSPDDNEG